MCLWVTASTRVWVCLCSWGFSMYVSNSGCWETKLHPRDLKQIWRRPGPQKPRDPPRVWQPKEVHHRDFLLLFLLLVLLLLNISVSDRLIFILKHLPSLLIAADLLNAFPLQISLFYLLKQAICSSPALQDWVGLMLLHKHWKGGLQRLRVFFNKII